MLTLFSTLKAFEGHFGTIQNNALESWIRLSPDAEIILFGSDRGTQHACERLGLTHVPDVAMNDLGTPLLSDMFARAKEMARHDIVCYANADIIFTQDFAEALRHVRVFHSQFLVVGRRCDLDVTEPIAFDQTDWDERLRMRAGTEGRHRSDSWIDYFAFARASMPSMPPFAVGRPGWDNWLLWNTRARGIPVIDATERVLALHQNHDYSHHTKGEKGVSQGEEAGQNRALIGTWARMFTIADSNYVLTQTGVKRNVSKAYAARRIEIFRRRLIDWSRPVRRWTGLKILNRSLHESPR